MSNYIYKCFNPIAQALVHTILTKNTTINIDSNSDTLSWLAYKQNTESINVIKNDGGGDCYFLSVAQAINNYNIMNTKDRIVYNNIYGNTLLFTKDLLRELVFEYVNEEYITPSVNNPTKLENFIQRGLANANTLNTMFKERLPIDNDTNYLQIVENLYNSYDNFFVQIPKHIDRGDSEPFKPIITSPFNPSDIDDIRKAIRTYMLSKHYWASEEATLAMVAKLHLNVITIEKMKEIDSLRCSYGIFDEQSGNTNKTQHSEWYKYLFLYYNNNHYELITFKRNYKQVNKKTKQSSIITEPIFIFNKNNHNNIMPPLCIFILIYFGKYYLLSNENRKFFSFFLPFIQTIDISFKTILGSALMYGVIMGIVNLIFSSYIDV
jgi:hypothetical protein